MASSSVLCSALHLDDAEVALLLPHVDIVTHAAGAAVFELGSPSTSVFVLLAGSVALTVCGQTLSVVDRPGLFGGVGLLDNSPRRSGCVAGAQGATVAAITRAALESGAHVPPALALKLVFQVGGTVNTLLSGDAVYSAQDVLLVQDGGCSPGYNSVTAYLVEELEKRGRRVTCAAQGFKSLVENRSDSYRILVHDDRLFKLISLAPGVLHAPTLHHRRGAAFRTERFAQFKEDALQQRAAQAIVERRVRVVVAIGGNGTFAGIQALARFLPPAVQLFFVPCTIDSDVGGTETIGQHTAVEFGAEKVRCYVADAATHERCYLLEMMGRDGGHHALYSAIGGGAHLALLPHSQPDLAALAACVTERSSTVIVVSEGYCRQAREAARHSGSASEYLLWQLRQTGQLDERRRRVVCEPFSRDIRGAPVNNSDLVLSQKMALQVALLTQRGATRVMPSVMGGRTGSIAFDDVRTDNTVSAEDEQLSNRLQ